MAVIAFIFLLIKTFTKYELPSGIDAIVDIFIGILVGLGIIIDPTSAGLIDNAPVAPKEINPVEITNDIR